MKKPTEMIKQEIKQNGCFGKTIKLHSYVVTLCKKDGSEVAAIRSEFFQNKTDVHLACLEQYPDWNVKTISRLYDEDFQP